MVLDDITRRRDRITGALVDAGVPHALIGGLAVAHWVATKDPDAVRTTKDVDLLLAEKDLPAARAAAHTVGLEYYELMNIGMFIEKDNPSPKRAVHLLWDNQRVREHDPLPTPDVSCGHEITQGQFVVPVRELVIMKLTANRRHDQVHLLDMIGVGLVDRSMMDALPGVLADRLEPLLAESGK